MRSREQFFKAYGIRIARRNQLEIVAFLLCLEIVMAFSNIGFIEVPPISLTTLSILVIVAAMFFGPLEGAAVSLVFAVSSVWKASMVSVEAGDIIFSPFLSGKPLESFIMAVITRILFAFFAGLIFRWFFSKERKHRTLGISVIAAISTAIHALLVYICMVVFFEVDKVETSSSFDRALILNNLLLYVITVLVTIAFDRIMRMKSVIQFFTAISSDDVVLSKDQRRNASVLIAVIMVLCLLIGMYFVNRFVGYFVDHDTNFMEYIPWTYSLMAQFSISVMAIFGMIALVFRWMQEYFSRLFADAVKDNRIIEAFANDNEVTVLFDLHTDSFKLLSGHENEDERITSLFEGSDAYKRYADSFVHPDDRKLFGSDYYTAEGIRSKLAVGNTLGYEYRRKTSDGDYAWYRVVFNRISENEVIIGFRDCNEEILYKHLGEKVIADFASVFIVNLNNDTYRFISRNEESGFEDVPGGIYTNTIKEYVSRVNPEYRDPWLKMCDIEKVRDILTHDKRLEYVYPLEGVDKRWRRCIIQALESENGIPSSFIMTYFVLDDTRAENLELTAKVMEQKAQIDESEKLIESVAASYDVAYAVNMKEDSYRLLKNVGSLLTDGDSFGSFSDSRESLLNIVHPSDREMMRHELDYDTIRQNLKDKKSYNIEYRILTDGETSWHEMNVTLIDSDNVALGFAENDIELTKLHLEEKRYDEYFALFVVDIDTGMLKIVKNEEHYQAVPVGSSVPYTEFIQTMASHLEDEPKAFYTKISDLDFINSELAVDDKRSYLYKSTRLSVGETWVEASVYVIHRHDDGTPSMFTLGFSVADALASERQELQTRLKEDMQMIGGLASGYHALYYINIDEGFFRIYALDGKRLPKAASLVQAGGDPAAVFAKFAQSDLVHPDDRQLFLSLNTEKIRERLSHAKKFTIRFRRNFSGDYHWSEMDVVKYEDIDEPANVIAIGFADRDADIRKEQEFMQQLEKAREAADEANKSKSTFLFNMSHDIRTPMNAIRGFTTMAKKHADDREKVDEYLDKIDISGQQLLTLINQVLEMARIESGKVELEEKPVNIRDEFFNMVTVLSEQAKSNGLTFRHSISNLEHCDILADKGRMGSVTLNIAGNAMKYTPKGGSIEFSLTEIESRKPGYASYVFTVADTGIGMSKEYLAKIYEPFSREKTSTVS